MPVCTILQSISRNDEDNYYFINNILVESTNTNLAWTQSVRLINEYILSTVTTYSSFRRCYFYKDNVIIPSEARHDPLSPAASWQLSGGGIPGQRAA